MTEDHNEQMGLVAAQFGGSQVLAKAAEDPFDYACRLTSGEVIYFESAEARGDWVHLSGVRRVVMEPLWYGPGGTREPEALGGLSFLERGVDVHRSHIVWIADAPHGG